MDFAPSAAQDELAAAARQLLEGHASPAQVRAHVESGEPYDAGLWDAMVQQGWVGVALPEAAGGLGLGWVEAALLLEEVGRANAPAPYLPSLLAAAALHEAGDHQSDVDALVAGDKVAAIGWSPDPGAVVARSDGDRWHLQGRPDLAEGAAVADLAVVAADDPDGDLGLFVVDLHASGRPAAQPAMDHTRSVAWFDFADTPAERIGGFDEWARLADRGAVATSAELLGGAARMLELATAYATDRVQFGQPIGSFQAVKHRCADMLVDVEGMRSAVWHAAWSLDAGDDPAVAASTAKVWCAPAAARTMASGLQVHGGIGFTWEHDVHLYLKRSQLTQQTFGDADHHRARLAALLRAKVRDGERVI
ncbi:MAG TPA: acyl-CoA dehydrogenase family protein [Acidimicrobiales bacterium]|jgi:alkylation response protein AidB-like acyl-CoA dehydrogenase|nr:acyl-CoA dehydrogenase family protein [Acidimicrobiales bacterium]